MEAPVATLKILGSHPGGELFEITVEIGRPVKVSGTPEEWACPCEVRPFEGGRFKPHSDCSFQALTLALTSAIRCLEYFREDGGQLFYAPGIPFEFEPFLVALRSVNSDA